MKYVLISIIAVIFTVGMLLIVHAIIPVKVVGTDAAIITYNSALIIVGVLMTTIIRCLEDAWTKYEQNV